MRINSQVGYFCSSSFIIAANKEAKIIKGKIKIITISSRYYDVDYEQKVQKYQFNRISTFDVAGRETLYPDLRFSGSARSKESMRLGV